MKKISEGLCPVCGGSGLRTTIQGKEVECSYCEGLGQVEKLNEEASRPVTTIRFNFPKGLIGVSDIHSQGQLQGLLTSFGRGVIDDHLRVKIGPVGSSHVSLASGMQDAKRFYFGYNKEEQVVYVNAKNGMDAAFIRKPKALQVILSNIFDMYRLSIAQGKRLQFQEGRGSMSVIENIAKKELGIETLETRNADHLDFYDLAVWQIKGALHKAYVMGMNTAANGHSFSEDLDDKAYKDYVNLKKTRLEDI